MSEIETVEVNKENLESLADNIARIADAVDGCYGREGQLTEDALVTLIHKRCGGKVKKPDIRQVIWALENLDDFIVGTKLELVSEN